MTDIDMKDLKVLVIDDEPFMLKLVARILYELGINDIFQAENGEEAFKIVRLHKKLDVIICDLEMPIMNGFEFVKKLRSNKNIPNPKVPVLILTGHSQEGNIREIIKLGVNGFLTKPVSKTALEKRIVAILNTKTINPKILDED